ncbi:MAG: type V CRISPR-associated protein Cas12b [Actinobacteria bacterium]|nr:type V CRISPR-associated protein Cas12b [Actinomycetota bacterium]
MAIAQRAYTLRLAGASPDNDSWREFLWKTHVAVNAGAKVFGDWLLTMRGGLDHRLIDTKSRKEKGKADCGTTREELRTRRVLLALSWLSVESKLGAPTKYIIATGEEDSSTRNTKVIDAFKKILKERGLSHNIITEWVEDCSASLCAAIRKDAVWVNRNEAFKDACNKFGREISQDEIWDLLGCFFGSRDDYFKPLHNFGEDSSETPASEKERDLVQKAGQWLSSRFGTGKGADFSKIGQAYEAIGEWAGKISSDIRKGTAEKSLANELSLKGFTLCSHDFDGILQLISGPGHKSATRNLISKFKQQSSITSQDISSLKERAAADAGKCASKSKSKGHLPYADAILEEVEQACGITYLAEKSGGNLPVSRRYQHPEEHGLGPTRHKEFAVMLDHAARKVCAVHTWIKHAEADRARFDKDAEKISNVPEQVKTWLDEYCEKRGEETGASEPYRIRRRAIDGWRDIVTAWSKRVCETFDDRVAEARRLQDELEKFGDIQLFEALATTDALCVWHKDGDQEETPTPDPLIDYVTAIEAENKKRRFKVPAYRHPHPLLHPVFCDFGESRWVIDYSLHKAAKEINKVREKVKNCEEAVAKEEKKLESCSGKESEREKVIEKLEKAKTNLEIVKKELDFLRNPNGVSMMLWTGRSLELVQMRWHSKRMTRDLAVIPKNESLSLKKVPRADRLGLAASEIHDGDFIEIAGLYEQKFWNGRLQAPRDQLEQLARYIEKHGWDENAEKMKSRLKWSLTFSAKLEPLGPWINYAKKNELSIDPQRRPYGSENKGRGDQAKLILCRLPGLRVLSVDLGHRHAAACAVWETLSESAFEKELSGRKILNGGPGKHDLYCHTRHKDDNGKSHVTIYRRIASDTLPDGEQHPAPWARLDRQFFIKLQGENEDVREASSEEIWRIHKMEEELGCIPPFIERLVQSGWGHTEKQRKRLQELEKLGWKPASVAKTGADKNAEDGFLVYKPRLAVDELMAHAVRILRLALKRHATHARIANAMVTRDKTLPGNRILTFNEDSGEYISYLQNILANWHALFSSPDWNDEWARKLWDKHIATLPGYMTPPEQNDSITTGERLYNRKNMREAFYAAARSLAKNHELRTFLYEAWSTRWEKDDERMRQHIRNLKDWIHPRGNVGAKGEIRHVGGLSLTRIATITEFRRKIQVGFYTRLHPDGTRMEISEGFGRKALDDLERLREQRVKQLASRIVEAALGAGSEDQTLWNGAKRPRQPINDPRFSPCHAIVIENLAHYRPDETRTRRENRQLMAWSASKVKEHLTNECLLYGIHLREIPANYTSRQDSRTGAPGIRCCDIPVAYFMRSRFWKDEVRHSDERRAANKGDTRDDYLCELNAKWANKSPRELEQAGDIRIPLRGGDIFVSADRTSPSAKGIQADLNAAANIGLRALLDPDWPGSWWYVGCDGFTYQPLSGKVKGSRAVDAETPLKTRSGEQNSDEKTRKNAKRQIASPKEVVNLWRDISPKTVSAKNGPWYEYSAYWNQVQSRVISQLRNRLVSERSRQE